MNRALSVMVILACFSGRANCETYTMETYYPSPAGVYTNVTVTSSTVLARDGGLVTVGSPARPGKLEVNGGADIRGVVVPGRSSYDPTDPTQKVEGGIYFNTTLKKHRTYKNGAWTDFGAESEYGCYQLVVADVSARGIGVLSDGKFTGLIVKLGATNAPYVTYCGNSASCAKDGLWKGYWAYGYAAGNAFLSSGFTIIATNMPVTNPVRCP